MARVLLARASMRIQLPATISFPVFPRCPWEGPHRTAESEVKKSLPSEKGSLQTSLSQGQAGLSCSIHLLRKTHGRPTRRGPVPVPTVPESLHSLGCPWVHIGFHVHEMGASFNRKPLHPQDKNHTVHHAANKRHSWCWRILFFHNSDSFAVSIMGSFSNHYLNVLT